MITPVCSRCIWLTNEQERFRRCPSVPILHRNMLCANKEHARKDHVDGESHRPFCEEVNRHGECLVYMPKGLSEPSISFDEFTCTITISGTSPLVITLDGTEPNAGMRPEEILDESGGGAYIYTVQIRHTAVVMAACVRDGVLSKTKSRTCEIPDVPAICFDRTTNTVSIQSFNTVFFTTDGSNVTEDSETYSNPFTIDRNTTIKARSLARGELSAQVQRYCISIEPPVIRFAEDTGEVTISADDTVLYSTDGSDIYDDAEEYDGPFIIDRNTLVKAACIVDGELSEQVELECRIPSVPAISYDQKSHRVTIESDNPVRYTTDGDDVRKKSTVYSSPFAISETCTVKAVSFVGDRLSGQAELLCVLVAAPEIRFDADTNTVSIAGDGTVLYSTDGSRIYDDSDEYKAPFAIEKNTTVRAACIRDGILSDEVSLECRVPSRPIIAFDAAKRTVSITGENTILYTTDGSDVRKKDTEYRAAFRITETTTVKARSVVDGRMSEQAERECVL